MRIIEKAIKANFFPQEMPAWKHIITVIMTHNQGVHHEDFPNCYGIHLDLIKNNRHYQVKYGLIENYIKLHK